MAEQRLIDANMLREKLFSYYPCINENTHKSNYMGETLMDYEVADMIEDCMDNAPTIDPETIPVVRQLREELARMTEERDALLPRKGYLSAEAGDGCMIIYRHNRESLEESQNVVMVKYTPQYVEVGYSETGKDGPYTMAINADKYGAITMAQEVAEAFFGFIRNKEAHP